MEPIKTPNDISNEIKQLTIAFKGATDWINRAKTIQKIQWGMLLAGAIALFWILSIAHDANLAADRAKDAADAVQRQQVVFCQSNNDLRSVDQYVWGTLWGIFSSNPESTDKDRHNLLLLKNFTDTSYAARDCSDLDKKYDFPPKPVLE